MAVKEALRADAVFEGGGVKGIGLAGAVAVAEEKGYQWENVAGTSAGAIVAALIAAGYTGVELKAIIKELDYNRFKDTSLIDRIPVLGPLASLVFEKGIYEGDFILEDYKGQEQYQFKLQVIASDITRGRMLVLPQDMEEYGIRSEALSVALAVRMSMSIPFFFEPITIRNAKTGDTSYIVDGGLLSNFPVWLFDTKEGTPEWPTFGFKLAEPEEGQPNEIHGPISLLTSLFATMMEAHDARYIEDKQFVRTIAIPTLGVKTTEFDISPERSEALYQSGRQAAEKFFKRWDFGQYINKYHM